MIKPVSNRTKVAQLVSRSSGAMQGPEIEKDEVVLPKRVVPTAQAAFTIYSSLLDDHTSRARVYAKIQGMIDGNPPYSQEALRRSGQIARSNVNWRDGEAIIESTSQAYWSLSSEVRNLVEIQTDFGDPNAMASLGEILSQETSRTIREWPEFKSKMAEHQADLIKFGISPIVFPDERDWTFNPIDVWSFLVPERTRNGAESLEIVFFETVMPSYKLWAILEEYKGSKWYVEQLEKVLIWEAMPGDKKKNNSSKEYAEIQRKIRNSDGSINQIYNKDITLVTILVRESDGKISRGIFHPVFDNQEWLFFADRQYERQLDAVHLFSYTPGERYVHGQKGVGHRNFNTIEGVTQIDNSLMDGIRRSQSVLVKTRAGKNKDLKQVQFSDGGFVDIGDSDFVQNLMGANLGSSIEGVRYFRGKLESNNNISGVSMYTPDAKIPTASQLRAQVTAEAKVRKNRIEHYYAQLDFLFQAVVRKMLNSKPGYPRYEEVKNWKERCIKRGVPEEIFEISKSNISPANGLPRHLQVAAVRASGSGSQFADQVEMESMLRMAGTMGERGKRHMLEDYVVAFRGHRYVDRYLPAADQQKLELPDHVIAGIENNQLEKGESVPVSPEMNQAIHAESHLERLKQLADGFNQAEAQAREAGSETPQLDAGKFGAYTLEEIDVAFQTIGPHFVRHLIFLDQDPTRKELAKSLMQRWAILANFGDKIANNAQAHRETEMRKAKKEQEQIQALSGEERVKMAKVESDARIKEAKLRYDMARASQRDNLQYLLQRTKVSFENELKRMKTVTELSIAAADSAEERTLGRRKNEEY